MLYFLVRYLDGRAERVPLRPGKILTIGRHARCEVRLDAYGVSSTHAELAIEGSQVVLKDLESTNGVFVNGVRVESAALEPGDRVLLGSALLVLQEAVSDRIRVGSTCASEKDAAEDSAFLFLSDAEHAYVPVKHAAPPGGGAEPFTGGDLELLGALVRAMDEEPSGSVNLQPILQTLIRVAGASGAFLMGTTGKELTVVAAEGVDQDLVISRSVLRRAQETGAPVVVSPPGDDELGLVCCPLAVGERPVGAVYLTAPPRRLPTVEAKVSRWDVVRRYLAVLTRLHLLEPAGPAAPGPQPGNPATDLREPVLEGTEFVAESRAMRRALEALDSLVQQEGPVLIAGELGTGKARAARRLHRLGPAPDGPYRVVPCDFEDEERLECLLFGEEDAEGGRERPGLLDQAHGGTLVLDEVERLPAPLQVKLLRFLQRGEFLRAGGTRPVRSQPRVLATTQVDLQRLAWQGAFSEELLQRLRRGFVSLPPLRERVADIVPLAQAFARAFARRHHRDVRGLSVDACRALQDYPWPGNVLELQWVIGRALLLAEDPILDVRQLPLDVSAGRLEVSQFEGLDALTELSWKDAKAALEQTYFREQLRRAGGNVSKAAQRAGIARKTLHDKLRQLNIRSD